MSIKQPYEIPVTEPSKHSMKESQLHDPDTVAIGEGEEMGKVDATPQGVSGQAAAEGGKQYRVLGRWKTAFVFIHTEIGIGILSLPSVLKKLGLIPGLIAILLIGLLATYTAYLYLIFWRKYQHVDNLPDAMRVLGGKPWAIVGGIALMINFILYLFLGGPPNSIDS